MGRLTPLEIREQEFKQSALGYSKDQVNQFLGEIADELETLIQESNELHVEKKAIELALKTYMTVEDSLKETLLLAQKTGQDTIRNAQNESDTIIRKANTEKDALLFSAKEDLSIVQNDIRTLKAQKDAILIKLKSVLRSNLEVLDQEFSDDDSAEKLSGETVNFADERIVDFSKTDLIVEDLEEEPEPEIIFDDTEAFSEE